MMIRVTKFGEITRFDLSRSLFGRGVYWTAAYLVDGLLIDTGCARTASGLLEIVPGNELEQIINTHSHEDHIGGNAGLQDSFPEIQIYAHPSALPVIGNPEKYQPLQPYRNYIWGMPRPSHGQPIEDGSIIKSNSHRFQVIYTPGHTSDHLCLYEPEEQWVFTGDLFVGGKDRAIRAGSDIWKIIDSLKLIAHLPLKGMFPGSARVRFDPLPDLQEKIDYLEMTGEKVLKLSDQGRNEKEISREVFGEPMWIELITWGHLSRRNLVRSYLFNQSD